MIRSFFSDERGNYALLTAVAIVPIMGALALAVDYAEMSRQRQETLNALDAAGIATARHIIDGGVTDEQAKAYAKSFFETNLGSVKPANTVLTVAASAEQHRRRHAEAHRGAQVQALLLRAFARLIGKSASDVNFSATLGNKAEEHARSGARSRQFGLDERNSAPVRARFASTCSRMRRSSSSTTMAGQAAIMKQISKPVQFARGAVRSVGQCRDGQCRRGLDGPAGNFAGPSREFRLAD